MLPHLSPTSGGLTGSPVAVPPPPHFRPALAVSSAQLGPRIPPAVGNTAARKAGLRYEAQVVDYFSAAFGQMFFAHTSIHFRDLNGARTCVPDGLVLTDDGWIVIVEIKSQHMPEAWWQLRKLYEPVVRVAFRTSKVAVLEVVKTYDPSMPFPERVTLHDDLDDLRREDFGVFRWKR